MIYPEIDWKENVKAMGFIPITRMMVLTGNRIIRMEIVHIVDEEIQSKVIFAIIAVN